MSDRKRKRGLALNVTELMAATGYGRAAIKRISPPLVCGKIRLADFWAHVEGMQYQETDVGVTHDELAIGAELAAEEAAELLASS